VTSDNYKQNQYLKTTSYLSIFRVSSYSGKRTALNPQRLF